MSRVVRCNQPLTTAPAISSCHTRSMPTGWQARPQEKDLGPGLVAAIRTQAGL